MKLLMLKGLPGSGKSTWAKIFTAHNPDWVRVNKDSLREMMGSYHFGKDEKLVRDWRDVLVMSALRRGKNVIVDDTNFDPKHEERLKNLIYGEQGLEDPLFICDFEIKFFDTPLEECIKNDLKRPNSVGQKVIRRMWNQYLAPKRPSVIDTYRPDLPFAIICDLDGTFALHNGRSPYDVDKCDTDLVNPIVRDIIVSKATDESSPVRILFVTGREEKYREKTSDWLKKNFGGFVELWMRPTGDKREDSVVKQEIYDAHIRGHYNVSFVLDDRDRVVNMWRRNGLTCLQVAEGDF